METKIDAAEILLPSTDIAADVDFWTLPDDPGLGFRMDQIFPADDPRIALLSGHGVRLRLVRDPSVSAVADAGTDAGPVIRLLYTPDSSSGAGSEAKERELKSPSGTRVVLVPSTTDPLSNPSKESQRQKHTQNQESLTIVRLNNTTTATNDNSNEGWIVGRAGMHYRDLIPSRLGGDIIASHIRIPSAGPVPDSVHFHDISFQLIYCKAGWVRLVYEDQGAPFILGQNDCVIQPPRIRHRVLESSAGLEVVEVGCPAEHMTTIDHEMVLPNDAVTGEQKEGRREREWDRQRFVLSRAEDAVWGPWIVSGFEARDTGVRDGTKGVADVRIVRPVADDTVHAATRVSDTIKHDADILFYFVLSGSSRVASNGVQHTLGEGDAFTVPRGWAMSMSTWSDDLSLLVVALPGKFDTTVTPCSSSFG